MWTETKHGLYKQYVFIDFPHAWEFMEQVSAVLLRLGRYPRWQNHANVVDFWLLTEDPPQGVSDKDWELARNIDALAADEKTDESAESVENITTKTTEVDIYADGGSRGNPGPSASGFVVQNMLGQVLEAKGICLGITTNNQAEYQALKFGLEAALHQIGAREVHVYMDSLLVVNQMKGIFKVKNRDLWPVHDAIKQLLPRFEKVTFTHVPRELNKLADAEVNKALDAQQFAAAKAAEQAQAESEQT